MCAVGLNGSDRPETVLNMIVEMHVWSLSSRKRRPAQRGVARDVNLPLDEVAQDAEGYP